MQIEICIKYSDSNAYSEFVMFVIVLELLLFYNYYIVLWLLIFEVSLKW